MADAPTPKRKGRTPGVRNGEGKSAKRNLPKSSIGDLKLNTMGMAALLGMKKTWLFELTKSGVIPKEATGTYDPTAAVHAYVEHLKDQRNKEKPDTPSSLDTVRELKAKELEVKLALKERELIELDEAIGLLEEVTGLFNAYLSGLPAEISRNQEERERVDAIIQQGKQRLSDRFEQAADSLATGLAADKAKAEE